jgi:hypothetical protein
VPAAALFVMIGATPHTDWLPDDVVRDQHGFILTGRDLPGKDGAKTGQPVPLPLETSVPGVFAAGDVRAGSVKRVASAVGEGSVAIPQVHQHLRRQTTRAASKISGTQRHRNQRPNFCPVLPKPTMGGLCQSPPRAADHVMSRASAVQGRRR